MQQNSKPLIVTLLSTILFGLLSYFGFSPDPQLASDTIAYADQATQAISAKNWIMLGTSLVSFIAVVYVWWKSRSAKTTLVLLVFASFGLDSCKDVPMLPATISIDQAESRTLTPRWPVRFFQIEASSSILSDLSGCGIKALPIGDDDYIYPTTDSGFDESDLESLLYGALITADVSELTPSSLTYNSNTYYYISSLSTDHPVYKELEIDYSGLSEARLKALTVASVILMQDIGGDIRPITEMVECEENGCDIVNNAETDYEDLCVCGGLSFLWDPWTFYDED